MERETELMSRHFVYILECKDKTLYTGYTNDLNRRIENHQQGKGAKYTRGRGPFQLMYSEQYDDKSVAMRREAEIKKWDKASKLKLIEKGKKSDGLEAIKLLDT
jgi:putative endonuclease